MKLDTDYIVFNIIIAGNSAREELYFYFGVTLGGKDIEFKLQNINIFLVYQAWKLHGHSPRPLNKEINFKNIYKQTNSEYVILSIFILIR